MSADEQRSTLVALARAEARVAELRLRVLAAGHGNDIAAVDASPSTGAWLAVATGTSRAAAHAQVRLAGRLDTTAPLVRAALAAGAVNLDQATAIVAALERLPESADATDRARAEQHLLGLAADHDAGWLARFGRKIGEVLDPDEADRRLGERLAAEERAAARRAWLKLRDNGDGTVSGSFKIPALHAAMLATALDALTAPRRQTSQDGAAAETRPGRPERWGQGFCELLERYPTHRLPTAGGANATVVVTLTLAQLLDGLGAAGVITGSRQHPHRDLRRRGPPARLRGRDHPRRARRPVGGPRPRPPPPAAHQGPTPRAHPARPALHRRALRPPRHLVRGPPRPALVTRRLHHRRHRPAALPLAPPQGPRPRLHPHPAPHRRAALHPTPIGATVLTASDR